MAAMQAFARVHETGSFSAAAKRLGLGQPAVSKLVAQLEEHLGAKLLLRSTRGLSPTDAGRRFYQHATQALEHAELALRSARGEDDAVAGRLRVGGTISFVRRYVVPRLPAFYAKHPGITLDLLLDDRTVGLVEEGVEVSLRMGRLTPSELLARKIGQCRRVVVGTTAYFAEHGVPQHPQELAAHPAVTLMLGEGGDQFTFTRGEEVAVVPLSPRLRVSALEGVRAGILAGLGVAVATEWMFGAERTDGRLQEVLGDWRLAPLDLWAVYTAGRAASARARAFVAFVEAELAATPFALRP